MALAGTPEMAEGTQEPTTMSVTEKEGPTLQEILVPIWANRKRILVISFAAALVTLGINFLLPVYYKSTATLLPETQKDKLSALGQFADIASLAGVNVPGSEIARLYPTIVNSETILRNVILRKYKTNAFADSVNLIEYFGYDDDPPAEAMDKALKELKGLLSASFENKTSTVTISVEMREPELAATVLNTIIAELDNFMRSKRVTNASEQVKWISARLREVEQDLRRAEDRLKEFRERNRRVADSPELLMQQERLLRDVQVQSTVFVELKKQYELAKLEEIKNITIVNVLDPGRVPVKKERPKRATNAGVAFLISLGGLFLYYGTKDRAMQMAMEYFIPAKGAVAK
jgi:uncharacterized protein involved in exopolysaccharide biosynthesis